MVEALPHAIGLGFRDLDSGLPVAGSRCELEMERLRCADVGVTPADACPSTDMAG